MVTRREPSGEELLGAVADDLGRDIVEIGFQHPDAVVLVESCPTAVPTKTRSKLGCSSRSRWPAPQPMRSMVIAATRSTALRPS